VRRPREPGQLRGRLEACGQAGDRPRWSGEHTGEHAGGDECEQKTSQHRVALRRAPRAALFKVHADGRIGYVKPQAGGALPRRRA
jgi:hypothetical protein